MGLRPTQNDENRVWRRYAGQSRGTEEVLTALDVLRP